MKKLVSLVLVVLFTQPVLALQNKNADQLRPEDLVVLIQEDLNYLESKGLIQPQLKRKTLKALELNLLSDGEGAKPRPLGGVER